MLIDYSILESYVVDKKKHTPSAPRGFNWLLGMALRGRWLIMRVNTYSDRHVLLELRKYVIEDLTIVGDMLRDADHIFNPNGTVNFILHM